MGFTLVIVPEKRESIRESDNKGNIDKTPGIRYAYYIITFSLCRKMEFLKEGSGFEKGNEAR